MPPPPRGKPYYDVNRGRMMIVPRGGGRAVPYVGPRGGFDPGKLLRRAGVQTRTLGGELAGDTARAASAVAERQPLDLAGLGRFLVAAAATLLGLIVLDLILSARGATAAERAFGLLGRGISRFVAPGDPLVTATVAAAAPAKTPPVSGGGSGAPAQPASADGRAFPVPGPGVSFVNDFNAPRADTGTHGGIDIFAPRGSGAVAVESGVLERVGWNDLGGWRLWIKGDSGDRYYYAHLDAYAAGVREGARVAAGQVLGSVGDTGNARGTSPHLHFEWRRGGGRLNPYDLLRRLRQAATTTKGAVT